jgi:hypothetical protein
LIVAVVVLAVADFCTWHTGRASFVNDHIAVVIDTVAHLERTSTAALVDFSVTIIVYSVTDLDCRNAVGCTDFVHIAVAVIVHTVALFRTSFAELLATRTLSVDT